MSDPQDSKIEPLGDEFEILEDPDVAAAVSPAPVAAVSPAPVGAGSPLPAGGAVPLRSVAAWTSFGLAIAVFGLLGPWGWLGAARGNLVHGALLAWSIWYLLRFGFAAVQPVGKPPAATIGGAALAVYGAARLALVGSDAVQDLFGWDATSMQGAIGAVFVLLGGALVIAAPALGGKRDAKLPPAVADAERDKQFTQSLLAYLLVFVGLLMPWASSGERGADSLFGALTLVFVGLVVWASWVGLWKLWTTPIVTGKLAIVLFLAPMEAALIGLLGVARVAMSGSEDPLGLQAAWPSRLDALDVWEPLLVFGGGPLLSLAGGGLAVWVLLHGTKAALATNKQRKAEETAARKAARDGRKSGGDKNGGRKSGGDEKDGRKSGGDEKDGRKSGGDKNGGRKSKHGAK